MLLTTNLAGGAHNLQVEAHPLKATGDTVVAELEQSGRMPDVAFRITNVSNKRLAVSRWKPNIEIQVRDRSGALLTDQRALVENPNVSLVTRLDLDWVILGDRESIIMSAQPIYARWAKFHPGNRHVPIGAYSIQCSMGRIFPNPDLPDYISYYGSAITELRWADSPTYKLIVKPDSTYRVEKLPVVRKKANRSVSSGTATDRSR
jgi:hypothetical protein